MTHNFHHIPVLLQETIQAVLPSAALLKHSIANNQKYLFIVDATLGGAGHACALANKFYSDPLYKGFDLYLIGIDQDTNAIKFATTQLEEIQKSHKDFKFKILHANFDQIGLILDELETEFLHEGCQEDRQENAKDNFKIHGFYADFGVSSPQLDQQERGFSFSHEGPLDMRMDQKVGMTAEDILLTYSETELAQIFYEYGEERKSRVLARAIIYDRQNSKLPHTNTKLFADYVKRILKYGYSRTHPATRIFQALRIEVNHELESIKTLLSDIPNRMHHHTKLCFISFHSLEDRLIKRSMRLWQEQGLGKELPRGGVTASSEELAQNMRARSARLRVFDFI